MGLPDFKDFFHFNKGERRGTFILGLILVAVIILRIAWPRAGRNEPVDFTDFRKMVESHRDPSSRVGHPADTPRDEILQGKPPLQPVPFDPNTVTREGLMDMGLEARLVNTFINYRKSGVTFHAPEHVRRVYGMNDSIYGILLPYIYFENNQISEPKKVAVISSTEHHPPAIELNGADSSDLIKLWGIGPVFSARIIRYRNLLGGFYDLHQLNEVYGLGPDTFDTIRHFLDLDTSLIFKMDLNQISLERLSGHPYMDPYRARAIIDYRTHHGGIATMEELVREKILTEDDLSKIRPYLKAGSQSP
jgi:DNA uptake protein ComE-like DNA-binding protein